MKNVFRTFAFALAGVFAMSMAACDKDKPAEPATVNPDSLTFTVDGGTQTVTVTGSGWTATPKEGWITVTTQTDAIEVTVGATTEERSGTIEVVNDGGTRIIAVTQSAPGKATFSPGSLTFAAQSAEAQTVTVTSDSDWTPATTDGWITISDITANTFKVSVDDNVAKETRNGSISISNSGGIATLTVAQAQIPEYQFIFAKGGYYGDEYGADRASFFVQLFGFKLDATGAPKGDGYWLIMDMIAELPSPDNTIYLDIAPGVYEVTDTKEKGTVYPNTPNTALEYVENGMFAEGPKLKSGSVTVAITGYEYTMKIDFTLTDDTVFRGSYNGPLGIQNPAIRSTLTDGVTFPKLTKGSLVNYGDLLGIGVYTYYTTIYGGGDIDIDEDGTLHGTGYYVNLEINSSGDGTAITAGSYGINETLFTAGNIFVGGMNGPTRAGSWYYKVEDGRITELAALRSGQVDISRTDAVYTINIDAADQNSNSVKGSFEGEWSRWSNIVLTSGKSSAPQAPLIIQAPSSAAKSSRKAVY